MFDIFDSYYMPSRTGRRRGTVFPSGFSFGSPYFSQDMDYEAAKKRKLAELEAQRRLYQQQQEQQAEIKRRKEQQLRAQQQLQERRRKAKQARKQRQNSVHPNVPVNENEDSHVMEERLTNERDSSMECEQISKTAQPPMETEEEEQVPCDTEQCETVSSAMKEEESEGEEEEEEEQVEEEEMEEETEDQVEGVSGEPEAENETMSPVLSTEQAAVTIQAWFRLCLVRKTHLLEQLKQFRAVEQQVKQICQQYNRQITEQAKTGSQVPQLEKRLVLWKGYEDALVRQLICLDGISSRGSEIGRERRKHTVSQIQSLLSQIDQRKLKLQQRIEEAKQQEQQQKQKQQEQEQEQRQKQQKAAHRSKAPAASRSKSAPLPGFPSFRQSPFYFNDF